MENQHQQLYDLAIPGLIFQEETNHYNYHLSYRYNQNVSIDVYINVYDSEIRVAIVSDKKTRAIKKLLKTMEAQISEELMNDPRYRMFLVTGNKDLHTHTSYDIFGFWDLVSVVDEHYGVWGQWVLLLCAIGVGIWNLSIGKWINMGLLILQLADIVYCGMKYIVCQGEPKAVEHAKRRIMTAGYGMSANMISFTILKLLTEAASHG